MRETTLEDALLVIYRLTKSMERFKIIGGDRFLKSDQKNLEQASYLLKKQNKINKCLRFEQENTTIERNPCGFCSAPKYLCECSNLTNLTSLILGQKIDKEFCKVCKYPKAICECEDYKITPY